MVRVTPRNSPKTPNSGKAGPENPRSPYRGGEISGKVSGTGAVCDLFGLEREAPRRNDRKEAAALAEVLQALRGHTAVAWCERMNSGAARMGSRFVRFGWPGCPDVLGQLKDGRLLGVEVKAPTGRLRPEQREFLGRIRDAGGVAFVALDCRDVWRELGDA